MLLLFQRKQVIQPDQEVSSSASDLDFRANFDAKMSSKDPWDQIFALYKIFRILREYEGNELDMWDKQLIKGIYLRRERTFKYLEKKGLAAFEKSYDDWEEHLSTEQSLHRSQHQSQDDLDELLNNLPSCGRSDHSNSKNSKRASKKPVDFKFGLMGMI